MIELKVTINGKTHIAPPPKLRHFKGFLRFLRTAGASDSSDASVDDLYAYIATLFDSPDGTAETINDASFEDGAKLRSTYSQWLSQYMPDDAKNGEAR